MMWKEQLNEPSESVKLAYIGNVYSTLNAFWGLRGRLALAVGVLSAILLEVTKIITICAYGVLRSSHTRWPTPMRKAGLSSASLQGILETSP
jgi:hypothetical protein